MIVIIAADGIGGKRSLAVCLPKKLFTEKNGLSLLGTTSLSREVNRSAACFFEIFNSAWSKGSRKSKERTLARKEIAEIYIILSKPNLILFIIGKCNLMLYIRAFFFATRS